jgi:hypothetical protein
MKRRFWAIGLSLAALWSATAAGPASGPPAATIDQDYVLALATANRFLCAWQMRDQEKGRALLSSNLRKQHKEEYFRQYLAGVSNPHHAAYEIGSGQRVAKDRFAFEVRLYQHTTGAKWTGPPPAPSQIFLRKAGAEAWRVDGLP